MKKTRVYDVKWEDKKILVGIKELQIMLGLGRAMSDQIGEQAGAVVRIGTRKLYNLKKVEEYIDSITGIE